MVFFSNDSFLNMEPVLSTNQPDTTINFDTTNEQAEHQVSEPLPLSYSQWPLDLLIQKEKSLTEKIENEGLIIDQAESSDVQFLLEQHKFYQRTSAALSLISKIIGGIGPITLTIVTAFGAPSYSNYIIAGLTATAVPIHHLSEQFEKTAVSYDRRARVVYNTNIIELQKIRAARKLQEQNTRLQKEIRRSRTPSQKKKMSK